MPVTISDDEYKEYRILQNNAIKQMKFDSIKGLSNLEQDIDVPIKRLVAMLALLRCEPMWSCCGFDYDGQPLHKSHEYGNVYVAMKDTPHTIALMKWLSDAKIMKLITNIPEEGKTINWVCWQRNDKTVFIRSDFDYDHEQISYPWSMKSCIHYPELAAHQISLLETTLMGLKDFFEDEVILSDTNKECKNRLPHWQYPSLKEWVIKKDAFMSELENKL